MSVKVKVESLSKEDTVFKSLGECITIDSLQRINFLPKSEIIIVT